MAVDPTVLVADDDDFMRDLLRAVFVKAGIPVHTYASARQLLDEADLGSPCVLLLDVNMPDVSGLELHRLLRERGVEAPVIFLTATADVPMAVAAMRAGATDLLEKPFHESALVERVRLAFARTVSAPAAAPPDSMLTIRLASLTPREREVFELMVTGETSKRMARALGGSFRTIETHRGRVMAKMAATSLADLVRMNLDARAAPKTPQ